MSTELTACPYCGNKGIKKSDIRFPYQMIECETCGLFATDYRNPLYSDRKNELSSFLFYQSLDRKVTDRKIALLSSEDLTTIPESGFSSQYYYHVTPQEIEAFCPKSFSEQISRLLLCLANLSRYVGDHVHLTLDQFFSAAYIKRFDADGNSLTKEDFQRQYSVIRHFLEENKYIDMLVQNGQCKFELLTNGWQQVNELQRNHIQNSKTVFIAMSFSDKMKNARDAIKAAISECGYIPRIMDEIEHNKQIVPEMLYEIRQARFVIADLTGHNNGAYYEAGYALGFGKEVIQLCSKEAFAEDGHFDVRQINTIQWETEDDLKEKLIKRIRATIE